MSITHVQYALLADVLRRRSGLALPPGKSALIQSKLAPVAGRFGFKEVSAMLAELEDEPEELTTAVTEAMTTNETSFFRDPVCFEHLRAAILPALKRARAHKRRLRIWSSAASAGQEPYSVAMLLCEIGLLPSDWKIDLFATDLSSEAVARIRNGVYSQFEVERGLPPSYRARYFKQVGEQWRIAGYLRRSLRVRRFNLLDNYSWLGEIDVILCRNVLLYFDHAERLDALARLEKCLAPDGWLILGTTESASSASDLFTPADARRGVYVKSRNAPARQARLAG
jgi:chemotaxis protein methyltransferase CheR